MSRLIRQVLGDFIDHGCVTYGASLAFYALFVLVPVPIFVVSGVGALIGDAAARAEVLAVLRRLAGAEMASTLSLALDSASETAAWRGAELFGLASGLFGGTAFFVELQEVLNKIWGVSARGPFGWLAFLRTRASSFVMVAVSGAVLLVLTLAYTVAGALADRLQPVMPMPVLTLRAVGLLAALVLIALLFALIFRFVPDAEISFRQVWRGALATALLFGLGKWLIGLYLQHIALATVYGAAGSLVLTLIWIYYSALAFLLGAELTRALGARGSISRTRRSRGRKSGPRRPTGRPSAARRGLPH